jgi:hypothetical protein
VFDDASPSHPYRKSFKVDICAIMMGAVANAELMPVLVQENKHSNLRRCRLRIRTRLTRNSGEFNDNASLGDDASEVCKAFIAENYVQTEEEVAQTAFESWIQFKEKSKLIIGMRLPPLTLLNALLLPCNRSSFRLTMHSKSTIQRAKLRLATKPPSLPYSIKRRNFSVSQLM